MSNVYLTLDYLAVATQLYRVLLEIVIIVSHFAGEPLGIAVCFVSIVIRQEDVPVADCRTLSDSVT